MPRSAHCSFIFFVLKKEKETNSLLFLFSLRHDNLFQDCHFTVEELSLLFILPERVLP